MAVNVTPLASEEEKARVFQLQMWSLCLGARGNVFYEHPQPHVVARRRARNKMARASRRINRR